MNIIYSVNFVWFNGLVRGDSPHFDKKKYRKKGVDVIKQYYKEIIIDLAKGDEKIEIDSLHRE